MPLPDLEAMWHAELLASSWRMSNGGSAAGLLGCGRGHAIWASNLWTMILRAGLCQQSGGPWHQPPGKQIVSNRNVKMFQIEGSWPQCRHACTRLARDSATSHRQRTSINLTWASQFVSLIQCPSVSSTMFLIIIQIFPPFEHVGNWKVCNHIDRLSLRKSEQAEQQPHTL